jgi:hypothetical protein
MRDIEFRGRTKDTLEWVYGWYLKKVIDGEEVHYIRDIVDDREWEVEVDSVGQYLEINDKNEDRIYYGSIIEVNLGDISKKIIIDDSFDIKRFFHWWVKNNINFNDVELLGNVIDNPELQKKRDD